MAIDLDDPIALMLAASAAFERAGMEAAAYGGLALGMYGEVRETRDADLASAGVDAEAAREPWMRSACSSGSRSSTSGSVGAC